MKFFTTTHSSLDQVFGADTTYAIPAYQRPYSWQSLGKTDQNNQVNRMWDDLWEFFSENDKEKEYFLGSMVIIQKESRTFEVVDGQQRLTTLALLFAAMRCFLDEHCKHPDLASFRDESISTLRKLLYNFSGVALIPKLKVKILRAAGGYDYNEVLERAVECKPASGVADPRYAEVADRYFKNRDYLCERLKEQFLAGGTFTVEHAERFNRFFSFLYVQVAIVLITTTSFDTAFTIFETLNNRGLPLTNRDLLRNFLLKELTDAGEENASAMWTALEENDLTEDFMGRWVESWRAQQQRSSAFNDLIKIYDADPVFRGLPGQPKAVRFYETFQRDLQYYGLIAEPRERVVDRAIRNKIRFLRVAGNERYSFNVMLALFRQLDYCGEPNEEVLDFLCTYQRWLLYVLLSPGGRFSNAAIYQSIGLIRADQLNDAKAVFDLGADGARRLVSYLGGALYHNANAKLILAEYVWQEEAAMDDVVAQELRWDAASLEHIIPQNPYPKSKWVTDFSDDFRAEYTYRLGNMTLLTVKMNAAAKNSEFVKKKDTYRKTLLPITKELASLDTLTPEYIQERHDRIANAVLRSLRL